MPDNDALIARAAAGKRVGDLLTDQEVNTAYREAVANLEKQILGFDPKDKENCMIAKAMLLGIRELWANFEGIVARGKEAEAIMAGTKTGTTTGRVL